MSGIVSFVTVMNLLNSHRATRTASYPKRIASEDERDSKTKKKTDNPFEHDNKEDYSQTFMDGIDEEESFYSEF